MNIFHGARFAATVFAFLCLSAAHAADVDAELRRAAKLHRAGDTPAAIAVWKLWAERDHVDAAYNLAMVHQYGDGVPQDFAQAMHWYRFAAERGDRVSQFQLGSMYHRGEGVAADETEAHRWFTRNRHEHTHHGHSAQMEAWRKQAATLIWERDMREAVAVSSREGGDVVAELKRRAAIVAMPSPAVPRAGSGAGQVLAKTTATP